MSATDLVAIALWVGVTLYAVLGGADFGAGLWDLLAGTSRRGEAARELIDRVLTPVWEANHVWLIFIMVVTWTAFAEAFGAISSTLFIPLSLAVLGIVLRGSGFAFRHVVRSSRHRRAFGLLFAVSSIVTPFFLGTAAGAIATGRVPADGTGDRLDSWLNLGSIAIGVMLVAMCGYLASVYLTTEARRAGETELEAYFRVRAIGAAVVAGAFAVVGLIAIHADARRLFDDLMSTGLPLVIGSGVLGIAALVQLVRGGPGARLLAAGAVTAVIWGWGLAQRPFILPDSLTINQAAAPHGTLVALFVVFAAAIVIVLPALTILLVLHQRQMLEEGE